MEFDGKDTILTEMFASVPLHVEETILSSRKAWIAAGILGIDDEALHDLSS